LPTKQKSFERYPQQRISLRCPSLTLAVSPPPPLPNAGEEHPRFELILSSLAIEMPNVSICASGARVGVWMKNSDVVHGHILEYDSIASLSPLKLQCGNFFVGFVAVNLSGLIRSKRELPTLPILQYGSGGPDLTIVVECISIKEAQQGVSLRMTDIELNAISVKVLSAGVSFTGNRGGDDVDPFALFLEDIHLQKGGQEAALTVKRASFALETHEQVQAITSVLKNYQGYSEWVPPETSDTLLTLHFSVAHTRWFVGSGLVLSEGPCIQMSSRNVNSLLQWKNGGLLEAQLTMESGEILGDFPREGVGLSLECESAEIRQSVPSSKNISLGATSIQMSAFPSIVGRKGDVKLGTTTFFTGLLKTSREATLMHISSLSFASFLKIENIRLFHQAYNLVRELIPQQGAYRAPSTQRSFPTPLLSDFSILDAHFPLHQTTGEKNPKTMRGDDSDYVFIPSRKTPSPRNPFIASKQLASEAIGDLLEQGLVHSLTILVTIDNLHIGVSHNTTNEGKGECIAECCYTAKACFLVPSENPVAVDSTDLGIDKVLGPREDETVSIQWSSVHIEMGKLCVRERIAGLDSGGVRNEGRETQGHVSGLVLLDIPSGFHFSWIERFEVHRHLNRPGSWGLEKMWRCSGEESALHSGSIVCTADVEGLVRVTLRGRFLLWAKDVFSNIQASLKKDSCRAPTKILPVCQLGDPLSLIGSPVLQEVQLSCVHILLTVRPEDYNISLSQLVDCFPRSMSPVYTPALNITLPPLNEVCLSIPPSTQSYPGSLLQALVMATFQSVSSIASPTSPTGRALALAALASSLPTQESRKLVASALVEGTAAILPHILPAPLSYLTVAVGAAIGNARAKQLGTIAKNYFTDQKATSGRKSLAREDYVHIDG